MCFLVRRASLKAHNIPHDLTVLFAGTVLKPSNSIARMGRARRAAVSGCSAFGSKTSRRSMGRVYWSEFRKHPDCLRYAGHCRR